MRGHLLVAAVAFSAALPSIASAADQVAEIRLAESRGAAIAAHDKAAWIATDAMIAALGDPRKEGLRGYMVVADGSDLRAIFYGDSGKAHVPIYEAVVRDGAIVSSAIVPVAERRPLGENVERLIRARDAIWGVDYQRCTDTTMNTVVLPAETGDDTIVYLLTGQKEAGTYPAGGHHRIIVSSKGKVRSRRAFTKSCIAFADKDASTGEKTAGVLLSHLMDPQPTEIHVWLSRWMGTPVYVITTDGRAWPVTDGKIGDPRPAPVKPAT